MTAKSKFNSKVKAIKKLGGDIPEKEARAIAKTSRLVRIKRKRLLLRGPKQQVYGTMHLHDDGTLHVRFPDGVEVEIDEQYPNAFFVKANNGDEPKKKKGKKKNEEEKKQIDKVGQV